MLILAVDTSSAVASVALVRDERVLCEYTMNHKKTHSQKLLPMMQQMMAEIGLTSEEIELYAVTTGPGSFTGLRIGVSTIKAMAYAMKKPVIGVSALDALAFNMMHAGALVCPIMDARNMQVYTALYQNEGSGQKKITENLALPLEELLQMIKENKQRVIFTGDGVDVHKEYIQSLLGDQCEFAAGNALYQKASSVAILAYQLSALGMDEDCFSIKPNYLRKPQAEREYEQRQIQDQAGR
jgi:tRNA threonylcarbamoyladenosine biosynthesis protein TsaB